MKNFPALHERIATQMDDMTNNEMKTTRKENEMRTTRNEMRTTRKTILCQKDPGRGIAVDNYRPISCLPLMWKLMTGMIANSVNEYLEMYNLLPEEQKGCRRNSRGTKDQLLIDKMVLNDCKKRHTNLVMTWIDYKKVYDMIPHSWILESLGLVQVSVNIVEFFRKSMKTWNINLTSCGEYLAKVDIRRGIFQGDSLSPLVSMICIIPLTQILRKVKSAYTLKNGEKLNHVLFMDDLKIFAKSKREVNGLFSTVQILRNDIGMEFGIKKCGVLVLKRGKILSSEGVELPDVERNKETEKNRYEYLQSWTKYLEQIGVIQ